jgi:glycosyltransferase involved in cell wall biosynthesis
VRTSDRVLTLSQQSYGELQQTFPDYKDKIAIVPAGVDTDTYAYHDDVMTTDTILTENGVSSKKYLLFVGNFEPRKNISYLLDVYVELRKDPIYADLSLLLIGGDGWRSGETAQRISALNEQGYSIIRPKNRVPDSQLPALYHESLAAMLLSVYEGFGMTPLEALSAGARVIVSDIPVLREVGDDAVAYVPLDNAPLAVNRIKSAVKNTVNHDAIARQLETFTWKHAAATLIRILDETISEKKR